MNLAIDRTYPQDSLTWNDFNREDLQPKSTKIAKATASIAIGLFVTGAIFTLSAHLLKYDTVAKISFGGLVPLGLGVLFSTGTVRDINETNTRNAELIRNLDAGVFIPRNVDADGTGGGS